jgi:phosphoesterase RecJ-like protein
MSKPAPVPQDLLDFIYNRKKFLVIGHKEPDGDCVGSQLALCSVLCRLGKEAIPCSAGPFKRTEVLPYQGLFTTALGEKEREGAAVIIVDCAAVSRTGDLALDGLPCAIIDHHATARPGPGSAEAPVFLDSTAPAVSFMIPALIEALGLEPTREEAELLFFGICTDTGFFRHLDENGADCLECASRLVRRGVSPKEIYKRIHGGKSLNSRYLLGILLGKTKPYFGGRLMLTTEEYEETQLLGLEGRDSDNLYQLLLSIGGVEAVAIIRQESPERCNIGLRSRNVLDVASIAAQFGGGGHKNAAGANLEGRIEDLCPRLLAAFGAPMSTG